MSKSVFISYAHDSEVHKQRVNSLRNRLVENGIDVVFDLDLSNSEQDWITWMRKSLKEAHSVIIVMTKSYYEAFTQTDFEKHKKKNRKKGIRFETSIIFKDIYKDYGSTSKYHCVYFEDEDILNIPEEFEFNSSAYKISSDTPSEFDQLVKKLPAYKKTNKELIHRDKVKFSSEFIHFINREQERQLFKDLLVYDDSNKILNKGKLVQVTGAAQIGKTAFINTCLSDFSDSSEYTDIELLVLDLNENTESVYSQAIHQCLNSLEPDDSYKRIAKKIDQDQIYLIITLTNASDLENPSYFFDKVCGFYLKLRDYLHGIRFSPRKSDVSLIIETREFIDFKRFGKSATYNSIDLRALNRKDVEYAIENFLNHKGKSKSQEFQRILDAAWDLTYGLPGAIKNIFTEFEKKYTKIYDLYEFNEPNFILKASSLFSDYVESCLLSREGQFLQCSDEEYLEKTTLAKHLCSFRVLDMSAISFCVKKTNVILDKNLKSDLNQLKYIFSGIFFLARSKSNFSKSLYEIDPSIRQVLMNYFYKPNVDKLNIHHEISSFYKSKALSNINIINNFYEENSEIIYSKEDIFNEIFWHETEISRIKRESTSIALERIGKVFWDIFNKIEFDDAKKEILIQINYYYADGKIDAESTEELRESFKRIESYTSEAALEVYKSFPLQIIEIDWGNV